MRLVCYACRSASAEAADGEIRRGVRRGDVRRVPAGREEWLPCGRPELETKRCVPFEACSLRFAPNLSTGVETATAAVSGVTRNLVASFKQRELEIQTGLLELPSQKE